jgi:hypothetical protein
MLNTANATSTSTSVNPRSSDMEAYRHVWVDG